MERTLDYGIGAGIRVGPVQYDYRGAGELDQAEARYVGRGRPAVDAVWADVEGFFVKSVRQVLDETFVRGVGLSGGDKRLRRMSAFGREVALGPVEDVAGKLDWKSISTPSGVGERWLVGESSITVEDSYFVLAEPDMREVNGVFVPPSPPTPPDYVWGNFEPLRFVHPNGWVLVNREVSEPVRGLVWGVTDTVEYRQLAVPD